MKVGTKIFLPILTIAIASFLVIKLVFLPGHVLNKGVDTAYKIKDKTLDEDMSIILYYR